MNRGAGRGGWNHGGRPTGPGVQPDAPTRPSATKPPVGPDVLARLREYYGTHPRMDSVTEWHRSRAGRAVLLWYNFAIGSSLEPAPHRRRETGRRVPRLFPRAPRRPADSRAVAGYASSGVPPEWPR